MTARISVALSFAVVLAAFGLAACSSMGADYETRVHVVRPGETLYTIAWRHGVDYRMLAQWNNLRDPDFIVAGQRLRLTPPAPSSARGSSSTRSSSTPTASTTRQPQSSSRSPTVPAPPVLPAPQWQWPTLGPLVYRYGNKAEIASGIGIGGREGQPVSAAAAGRIVYAGSGLAGYGQLVIIKHNDTYLSAYGHNARLLVMQGQEVRRGDQIAEMGLGPKRQPRLHFEIRRNGTPVDPMPYLGRAGAG